MYRMTTEPSSTNSAEFAQLFATSLTKYPRFRHRTTFFNVATLIDEDVALLQSRGVLYAPEWRVLAANPLEPTHT